MASKSTLTICQWWIVKKHENIVLLIFVDLDLEDFRFSTECRMEILLEFSLNVCENSKILDTASKYSKKKKKKNDKSTRAKF